MKLPKKLTETEMETFLETNGYNIRYGNEDLIDSTLVCDYAADLGYSVHIKPGDVLEFTLSE